MNKQIKYLSASVLMLTTLNFAVARENVGKKTKPNVNLSKVASGCNPTTAQTDLDFNNIRARIFVGGDMWWDLVGNPQYEVPQGGGIHSMFAGSIWVGGYDATNNLKVAAQTYRQGPTNDFWAGPVSTSAGFPDVTAPTCLKYDRHWRLTKEEVDNFVNTGVSTKDIREWPGNGNVADGELQLLAPFEDVNGNGLYEYGAGDYPRYNFSGEFPADPNNPGLSLCNDYIFGDKTLWWVFNDVGNVKTETNSPPIGLEIRAQAFAFKTNDEINNMTFYKYQIINRSSATFDSTYFGQWVDPDLGNYNDDYVGCDVGLGLGFVYNGDADDDVSATGYGINPPSLGVDFFQGPLADTGDLIDNDKDGIIDEAGEQIIMSKFVYYENDFSDYGNPEAIDDYYQYLTGSWKNADRITHDGVNGRDQGSPVCNYMFPDNTDPEFASFPAWTEATAGNVAADRRFLQSAGEFTLAAGAVNYITTGVIWARATSGGQLESVKFVKIADEKAQALFNNCFKTLDGPDAPDVEIRELNNTLILSLKKTANKKVELYSEIDPAISYTAEPDTEKHKYNFQGYLIYQYKDASITTGDLNNPDVCRLLYQIDRKDGVDKIINWAFDANFGGYVPTQHTYTSGERAEADKGLKHSFVITDDEFALADKKLINHKAYYYTVISYAYNNYKPFEPTIPSSNNTTQQKPFLAGRNNIKTYTGIPHNPVVEAGGQIFNSEIGDGVMIKRIEGQGNGGQLLDMAADSREQALQSPYIVSNPVYEVGKGPLNIKVYDPAKTEHGHFDVAFTGVSNTDKWFLNEEETESEDSSIYTISEPNEQLIVTGKFVFNSLTGKDDLVTYDWGLTADISNLVIEAGNVGAENNGLLEGTIEFANSNAWLTGVKDIDDADGSSPENWIKSGTDVDQGDPYSGYDDEEVYENVIGGTWAPFKLVSKSDVLFNPKPNSSVLSAASDEKKIGLSLGNPLSKTSIASVDIIITSDKSKWSRCAVVETGFPESGNVGGAKRFGLRKERSIDKDGRKFGDPDANNSEAGLVADSGMGWFPGYAVNLETGERLNMAYGENSQLGDNSSIGNYHGTDMVWNPTSDIFDANDKVIFGGMHYLYVFGHNGDAATDVPIYDDGARIHSLLKLNTNPSLKNAWLHAMWVTMPLLEKDKQLLSDDVKVRLRVAKQYRKFNTNFNTPLNSAAVLDPGKTYYVLTGPITYNGVPFNVGTSFTVLPGLPTSFTGGTIIDTKNGAYPMYEFGTDGMAPSKGVTDVAKNALDLIKVVPNPYYAYSSYEKKQNDSWAKFTNLPAKCKLSIYTINGTLVRRFNRDEQSDLSAGAPAGLSQGTESGSGNSDTSLDWDLNNDAGVPIASGVYLIHVEAPGLGERTLKWFGVMRPIDLDSY